MDLTDEQWRLIEPCLPPLPPPHPGRPPRDGRAVLNGILWKIRTREPWYNMPPAYPSHQTCYRYYLKWQRTGLLKKIYAILAEDLRSRGGLDLPQAVRDGIIPLVPEGSRWHLRIPPQYQGTWQLATALLFLSLAIEKLKVKSIQATRSPFFGE